jgi:hypothetical protein
MKYSSFVYVWPLPIVFIHPISIKLNSNPGKGNAPQVVMFVLQSAATWGFAFEYASTITHFLPISQSVRVANLQLGKNSPFITDGRVEELAHGILPYVLNPLSIIKEL